MNDEVTVSNFSIVRFDSLLHVNISITCNSEICIPDVTTAGLALARRHVNSCNAVLRALARAVVHYHERYVIADVRFNGSFSNT